MRSFSALNIYPDREDSKYSYESATVLPKILNSYDRDRFFVAGEKFKGKSSKY